MSAFEAAIDEKVMALSSTNERLLEVARAAYAEKGRGAMVTVFKSFTHLIATPSRTVTIFVPECDLATFAYARSRLFVQSYNPQTHFVHLISVNVDGENTVQKAYIVTPDPERTATPADHTLDVMRTTDRFADMKTCCNVTCTADGIKRCGRCRDAYYCSPECQKNDWLAHRRVCRKVAAARADAKAFAK